MANKTLRLRAILAGAILMALIGLVLSKSQGSFHWGSSDPGEFVTVLVADHYVPAYTIIKPALVRLQEFPKTLAPPGALHNKAELLNENQQMLFTSAIAIPENQPITRALLIDSSLSDTLGSSIRPGKVAVSFEIDKAHGVGGWIRPGDTIAIFGAVPMDIKGNRALGKKTRLLLPSVIVVAVDSQRLGQGKSEETTPDVLGASDAMTMSGAKIVTVLVSPIDASSLIEAREDGSLSIVLRSLGDNIPWPN